MSKKNNSTTKYPWQYGTLSITANVTGTPHKCVNCSVEVWLGVFFDGNFLCIDCNNNAANIIYNLKQEIKKKNNQIKNLKIKK